MIHRSIQIIVNELNASQGEAGPDFAMMANIAHADGGTGASSGDIKSAVVVTLVNIEEEKTLKNQPVYVRDGDQVQKIKPLIYLNLLLLFSCADDAYEEALKKMDVVVGFFQANHVFTPGAGRVERMTVEMVSLSLEQQNHLWAILGSKQLPALLYKLRLVIVDKAVPEDASVVRAIRTDASFS
jgi:Pvc16 N-terminal domain